MPKNLEAKISAAAKKLIFEAKYGDIIWLRFSKMCFFKNHDGGATPEQLCFGIVPGNPSKPVFPGATTIVGEYADYIEPDKRNGAGLLNFVVSWDRDNDPAIRFYVPANIIEAYKIVGHNSGAYLEGTEDEWIKGK